jgi:hypothetical protein
MKLILTMVFFLGEVVLAFIANTKFLDAIDLVNQHLAEDQQIALIGANMRAFEILRLYTMYDPNSGLRRTIMCAGTVGFLCFLLVAVLLLFT